MGGKCGVDARWVSSWKLGTVVSHIHPDRQINIRWALRCPIPVVAKQLFISSPSHTLMGKVEASLFSRRKSVESQMLITLSQVSSCVLWVVLQGLLAHYATYIQISLE